MGHLPQNRGTRRIRCFLGDHGLYCERHHLLLLWRGLHQFYCQVYVLTDLWAARYNTWLLITLTPKGVVFSFLSTDLAGYL